MKPTLEDRKQTIMKEGEAIQKQYEKIAKDRDTLNRQLSQLQTRGVELNGQLQLVNQQIEDRDAEAKAPKILPATNKPLGLKG